MKENCLYFDISRKERDSAIRYLLGSIIKCRSQDNYYSNQTTYDEDVNIYLAHLLFAISLPEYHDMAEPYLSMDSSEVMQWVNDSDDQTIRYFIFKVNADHILVHTTVFDDLAGKDGKKHYKHSKKYYRELAKLYYEQAAAYHKRIYRKKTGVGDVLDKISYNYDFYQGLLGEVRRKYFHFLNNFRDQVFHGFMKKLTTYENDVVKQQKMDEFLDLYGQWLESKDERLEERIIGIIFELKGIDPEFNCEAIKHFKQGGDDHEERCA